MRQVVIALSLALWVVAGAITAQCGSSSSYLLSVYFIDESRGWILGTANGQSYLFQTTDGGERWSERYRSTGGLSAIKFANENVGWMVGGNGLILRTSDGGSSWTSQKSGVKVLLTGLAIVDPNNAWVSGASGTMLSTQDGGETWSKHDLDTKASISDVVFTDANHGWAIAYGVIFSTVDGGETWSAKSSGERKQLSSLSFANAETGWITAGPGFLQTTDGGKTWRESIPPSQGQISGLSFVDTQTGWIAKSRGTEGSTVHIPGHDELSSESFILSTVDGGATWQNVFHIESKSDHSSWILDLFFINRTHGWAVGRDGLILRTVDAGKSWQKTLLSLPVPEKSPGV